VRSEATIARIAWSALLLTPVVLAGTVMPAGKESPEELAERFREALERRAWDKAIAVGVTLAELQRDSAATAYNLACAYAMTGQEIAAAAWLKRAASAGFSGLHLVTTDPDLATVRGLPDYLEALQRIRENRARDFDELKQAAEGTEPLVVLPEGHDPARPAPLIVALHGYGSRGAELAEVWRGAAQKVGAILVAPDALRRTPTGYDWRYVDESDWLVARAIDRVAAEHAVDESRIVLSGFSQGANIALHVGMQHPERFCGLIPVVGHYEPHRLPEVAAERMPAVALMTGAEDPSVETFRAAQRDFEAAGYRARLRVYPGVGHAFPPTRTRELRKALRFTCGL
jgi:phospholipase/carboxylesterase